jgi:hypothetical protein
MGAASFLQLLQIPLRREETTPDLIEGQIPALMLGAQGPMRGAWKEEACRFLQGHKAVLGGGHHPCRTLRAASIERDPWITRLR